LRWLLQLFMRRSPNKAGSAAPSAAELKAIAEEGFIYGLPIVMN